MNGQLRKNPTHQQHLPSNNELLSEEEDQEETTTAAATSNEQKQRDQSLSAKNLDKSTNKNYFISSNSIHADTLSNTNNQLVFNLVFPFARQQHTKTNRNEPHSEMVQLKKGVKLRFEKLYIFCVCLFVCLFKRVFPTRI